MGKIVLCGCAAVVTKDIPDGTIVAGVPAKKIKTIEEYYEKHKNNVDFTKQLSPQEKKEYLINKYKLYERG